MEKKDKKKKKKPAPVGIPFSEMHYINFYFLSCDTQRVPTRYPLGIMGF
jgi:hypothetical protein